MTSTGRVMLWGALAGVIAVVVAVALVLTGVLHLPGAKSSAERSTLLVLVMPDDHGVLVPRVIDLYSGTGSSARVTSVDPLESAVVPGTSGNTLRDAFAYGGGSKLAAAYTANHGGDTPSYVVIDPDAWFALMGERQLLLDLPADINVFDGKDLYEFDRGEHAIESSRVVEVLKGADYLSSGDRRVVRAEVGDLLKLRLGVDGTDTLNVAKSDLDAEGESVFLARVKSAVRQ